MYNAAIDNTYSQSFGQNLSDAKRARKAGKNSLVALMSAIGFLRNHQSLSSTTVPTENPSRAFARPQQQARQLRVQESDCVRSAN